MNQYVMIIAWLLILMYISKGWNFKRIEYIENVEVVRFHKVFAWIAVAPLIFMVMNRPYGFGDTSGYVSYFRGMPDNFSELLTFVKTLKKDPGFYAGSALVRVIIGNHDRGYLLIIAVIQIGCLIAFFRKYSVDYVFSMFLFIASTDYLTWMFNGIRQFTAVAFCILAVSCLYQRKYLMTILLLLIASTMHQSALLMIPLVVIAQGKAWNWKTFFFMFTAILAFSFVEGFTTLMDNALSSTQYVNVVSDYTAWKDDGTNPIRALIYSVPAIISFFYRERIWQEQDRVLNFCVNMSIMTMGLYIVSVATSGLFLGRLPIYASLFSFVLLPWEIENCFSYGNKQIIKRLAIVMYVAYYLVQIKANGLI